MATVVRKRLSWVLVAVALSVVVWQGTLVQQAQTAKEDAETRWELSIAGSLNGMFDCQLSVGYPEGHVNWARSEAWYSPHFLQLLGVADMGDSTLCAFLDLVHADDRHELEHLLSMAVRNKAQVQKEVRVDHPDGTEHWYLLSAVGTHNHVRRISGSILDITHSKVEQRRSDLIILSAHEAIVVCGEDRQIILVNAAVEEMFGWSAAELCGSRIDRLVTEEYLARHDAVFDQALARLRGAPDNWQIRQSCIEGVGQNRDGEVFPITLCVRGIKYHGRIEFIATIQRCDSGSSRPLLESLPLPQQQSYQMRQDANVVRAFQ